MEISGYPHYENVCSNILKFYLDPTDEHGINNLVLDSLMQLVVKEFKFDADFDTIQVFREYKTNKNNRLDILILTSKFAIGIENKIFHHLHNDLSDYKNTVKSLSIGQREPVYIVLSLNKITSEKDLEKINNNDFNNVTYEQLFQTIKQNIGAYLNNSNTVYINYLLDFIKSIENLTPKTMENKALWSFFKTNSESIQELTKSFDEYKKSIYQKVNQLQAVLPQIEFAPTVDKQWVYENRCLVHDFTINSKYNISVDAYISLSGWEIQLFGRNNDSTNYLYNIMCNDSDFLPKSIESYEVGERLIYQKFDSDEEISNVANTLADLLNRIEKYKKHIERKI